MVTDIEQIPKTALDVFRTLPEGTPCEVIDNVLYMSPAPKYNHQRLLGILFNKISKYIEVEQSGEIILAPFDVYFDDLLSAVQPDLVFILKENMHILKHDGYVHGTPDLIVEVLSADKNRDLVLKKALYEHAGVKEYFTVNPDNNKVKAWVLTNGIYKPAYEATGRFYSALLNLEFTF